jgi:subtilase family serine protease
VKSQASRYLVLMATLAALTMPASASSAPVLRDLGRAPATLAVRVAVTLAYRHPYELQALVAAQSNPRSPLFRHYLSNGQFNAYFAPTDLQHAFVTSALERAGFRIEHTFANRTVVDAVAPRAQAERFFSVEIHAYDQPGQGVRYANTRAAIIPAELHGLVSAVTGLDDLVSFAPRYLTGSLPPIWPQAIGGPLRGGSGHDGPLAYAQGYDEPVQHGYDGSGRAIGNAMAGDIGDADLTAYLKYFNIKQPHGLIRIAVDGGKLNHDDVETTLDIEAMSGTTPGAQIYLYSFPEFTDKAAEDAYNQVVSDDFVESLNSSWGGCELSKRALGKAFAIASNQIFEQGAAKGISFPVATGDYGAASCGKVAGKYQQSTPDTDPYALAVGGTNLKVNKHGDWVSETGWRGSEGGISLLFSQPYYQVGVAGVDPSGRNIPDVALSAGQQSAFDLYYRGSWGAVWGTSLASPLFTGLVGQIDQVKDTRIGFVNPQLYAILQGTSYGQLFHDITQGNNGYPAGPGYDLVTGIGSPIGWPLASSL